MVWCVPGPTPVSKLKSKLVELEERRRRDELAREKADPQDFAWGSQIRSYVLNPYTVIFTGRTSIALLGYAALPWLLLIVYRGVRDLRGWTGWHHHVALVCLAQLFTLIERRLAKRTRPLLSVRDITELLEIYLPRRPRTEEEVLRKIARRHLARKRDIDRHRKTPASGRK